MTTLQAGQSRIAEVDLSVYGDDTVAVLTIIKPDDTTLTPDVTGSSGNAHWETDDAYTLVAGEIIERWTVTGFGATTIDHTIQVGPVANPVNGLRVYATSTDYANELHVAPPAGIRRALEVASGIVDQMLKTAYYDVDDDGMPTDAAVIAAMRRATCLQAEFAGAAGDRNVVGAAKPASFSLGKLSVSRAQAAPGTSGMGGIGPRGEWSQRAWDVLDEAGLTGHSPAEPWSWY